MKGFVVLLFFSLGLLSGDFSSSEESENDDEDVSYEAPKYNSPPPDLIISLSKLALGELETNYLCLFGPGWKEVYSKHLLDPVGAREELKEIYFAAKARTEAAQKLLEVFPSQNRRH